MTRGLKHILTLITLSAVLVSCNKSQEPYVLVGTAVDYEKDSLFLSLPVEGNFFQSINYKTVPVNEDGSFEFVIDSETSGFAYFLHRELRDYINIWIEPGKKDSIVIDFGKKVKPVFYGDQGEVLNTFNSFERVFYFHAGDKIEWRYMKDSIPTKVYSKIMSESAKEYTVLDSLFEENKISAAFVDAAKIDSEYHWKMVFASVAWHHYYYKYLLKRESVYNDAWEAEYKRLFEETSIANDRALVSRNFREFLDDYAMITDTWSNPERDTTLSISELMDQSHEQRVEVLNELYEGKIKESVWAYYLAFGGMQKQFEKSLMYSFEDFKNEYPTSPFTDYVNGFIEPIREYHARLESPMSDEIILIENAHEFTTWEEVIDPYKGELLYVDLWATWCGPCKTEFAHKEGLYEFIKDKPIKILYVSSDREDYDQKWKDMVNFYGLKGINMRINDTLNWDIWKLIHDKDLASIPRYLIIDQEGKMVEKDAARPSEGQKLFDQLAKYL